MAHKITLLIEDANWPEFKKFFLAAWPNQTIGTPQQISDDEWIAYRVLLFTRGSYEKGFIEDFNTQNQPNPNKLIVTLL